MKLVRKEVVVARFEVEGSRLVLVLVLVISVFYMISAARFPFYVYAIYNGRS